MKQRFADYLFWVFIGTALLYLCEAIASGQTMNDRSPGACAKNKAWLEDCFRRGVIAKVPTGTLYINETVEMPAQVGCGRIEGEGSAGYWIPIGHQPLSTNVIDGKRVWFTSRIAQVTPNIPALRIGGVGAVVRLVWFEGQGDAAAIEVEGRNTGVASGHHRFELLTFYNWRQCFKALAGYYKSDGSFVKDENHADNSTARNCVAFNCDTLFRSENQQSVNWKFVDWFHQGTTRNGSCVEFDIQRGGSVTVDGLVVENAKFTLIRVKDFSPNNCWFDFRGVWVDTMLDPQTNFCWFEYAGDPNAAAWSKWSLKLDAFTGTQKKPIEQHEQFKVPANLPRDDWQVKIHHVKQGG